MLNYTAQSQTGLKQLATISLIKASVLHEAMNYSSKIMQMPY